MGWSADVPATPLPALVLRLGLAYDCEEPNTWPILAIFVGFLTGGIALRWVPVAGLLLANATRYPCAPSHSETAGVLAALAFFCLPLPLLLAKVRALERVRIDHGRR